ncbi:MAG TPA: outer membrane beta-barrel protein [Gemmatimonadaceae bacterium]|nr:outer membrane beta-barrel protein [Gemmatimonadaceae bacterium]
MRSRILALYCACMATWATTLAAQRPLSLGIGGGVSVPEGRLNDGVNAGWHALGTLALTSPMQPIGLRLDLAYNRFAFDEAPVDGHTSASSATLNFTYRLPAAGAPLSPYLISGLGAYRTQCSDGPGCDSDTHYGWNVGLGTVFHFLGVRTFLEARYHRTKQHDVRVRYIPVTLGLLI